MRLFFAFLMLSFLTYGDATFKLLKSKLKPTTVIQPVASYKAVKYLPPVVVPEPLPATFARPVSTYVALPPYGVALPPVETYAAPVYTAPAEPWTVVAPPYHGHETLYVEPLTSYLIEES